MALNGISTLTIPTGLTATSYTQASSYLVAVGTFNYDAYGAGFAIRKDGGAIDAYMAQVIALGAGTRNWTFVPGNGQPSFTRSMTQPDGTNESNDPSESGVDIWNVATAAGNLSGAGENQINISLIPNGTAFTIYATELGGGGGADKEARQIAKLNIAQAKRQGKTVATDGTISGVVDSTKPYYRAKNTYDLAFLADTYATTGDDNANTSGLVRGRPWYDPNTEATYDGEVIEVSPGIWRTNYQNYYFEDGNFFDTAALKTGGAAYNGPTSDISIPDLPEYTSIMLKGYMKVTYTGTYTFYVDCDDGAYMWFGDNAIDNWKGPTGTLINYDINNGGEHGQQEVAGTVNLTAGSYIPLRVAFGNNGGPGILIVSYSHTGQAKTSDFTGKIFYRTSTNGF